MPKIEFCFCLEKGPCSRLTTRQFKTGDTANKKESAATGKIISRFLLHYKVVMSRANKKLSFWGKYDSGYQEETYTYYFV